MFAHDLSDSHSGLNNSFFNCKAATSIFYPPGGSIIKTDPKND
jgi:hypothetical protein